MKNDMEITPLKADTVVAQILRVLESCEQYGHHPDVIHVRRSTITKLYHELTRSDIDGTSLPEALDKGFTMFGTTFVPEPDVDDMWVHGDGIRK